MIIKQVEALELRFDEEVKDKGEGLGDMIREMEEKLGEADDDDKEFSERHEIQPYLLPKLVKNRTLSKK